MMQPKSRIGRLKILLYFLLCSGIHNFVAALEKKTVLQLTGKKFSDQPSIKNTIDTTGPKEDETKTLVRKSRQSSNLPIQEEILTSDQQEMNSDLGMKKYISQIKKNTLIPNLRVGRSGAFDENSIFPYPDSWIIPRLSKNPDTLKEIDESISYDELIEDDFSNKQVVSFDNTDSDSVDEYENENSEENLSSKNSMESFEIMSDDLPSKSVMERQIGENGTVIPYPRFGKRSNALVRNKRTAESLIPQIRYGRSATENKSSKTQKQPFYILPNYRPGRSLSGQTTSWNIDKMSNQRILPYPRPGRSDTSGSRTNYMLPLPRFGRSINDRRDPFKTIETDSPNDLEELIKSEESKIFLIPYPRPGKRFFGTKPLPPNVKFESKGKEFSILDTNDKDPNLTVFVVPYPRPGRSNVEKKDFMVPNIRFGRSALSSMVPYPRLGRSTKEDSQYFILPYPRAGRSSNKVSLVPYPRFGRSGSNVLPHFRFGKSYGSILPNPRFGRSESNPTYPKVNRETVSRSIIPQIRVGKSADFEFSHQNDDIPEIQKSMSETMYQSESESENSGESEDVSKYQSEKLKSALLVPTKKLHKHMLIHDTHYMLPYPRPGRYV